MISATAISTTGLVLDVLGASLLFIFGVTSGPAKGGVQTFILEQSDADEGAAYDRRWIITRVGFGLIIVGSLLQVWSNYR